jgi:hypothetical protein
LLALIGQLQLNRPLLSGLIPAVVALVLWALGSQPRPRRRAGDALLAPRAVTAGALL